MEESQFNARLNLLSSLIGKIEGQELFIAEYESLLIDVKALSGPRFERLQRMAKILASETEYMMNLFLEEKRGEVQLNTGASN